MGFWRLRRNVQGNERGRGLSELQKDLGEEASAVLVP